MTRQDVIDGYMINEKHVIAEMLYDTITKYENRIKDLEQPKTCYGCKHIEQKGSCYDCSRYYIDYYQPKETE